MLNEHKRQITNADIEAFNRATGRTDETDEAHSLFAAIYVPSLLSDLYTQSENIHFSQSIKCRRTVRAGDELTIETEIEAQDDERKVLKIIILNQDKELILEGEAVIQLKPDKEQQVVMM